MIIPPNINQKIVTPGDQAVRLEHVEDNFTGEASWLMLRRGVACVPRLTACIFRLFGSHLG